MKKNTVKLLAFFLLTFLIDALPLSFAQSPASLPEEGALKPYVETIQKAGKGMTLWETIQSGGVTMLFLGILSVMMSTLVIYMFARFDVKKLVPQEFSQRILKLLYQKNYTEARKLCEGNDNIVANIVSATLEKTDQESTKIKETLEIAARNEVEGLWTSLNYLADIAQVAPLLGLLGTVLGLLQAFNTIAFEAAVVKPILLAGGVSKAMITTAAGLMIAIPTIFFYSLLRPRVQNITNYLETITSEIAEALSR
ncbi:MAG: MotA/TolQ/ExbB proton channel family protein [Candidatus Omnitrophica bacterium]|nr:MotA/TolQ/ExbB proton channel family protein [Candidatus Omnitrophota bacterium]